MPARFPAGVKIHECEIRYVDPVSNNEELWVPKDAQERNFQKWERYIVPKNADEQVNGAVKYLCINVQECVVDLRGKIRKLFGGCFSEGTYGELWIPSPEGRMASLLTQKSKKRFLVWAAESGVKLDKETIDHFFPQAISVTECANAWVIHDAEEEVADERSTETTGSFPQTSFAVTERKKTDYFTRENLVKEWRKK